VSVDPNIIGQRRSSFSKISTANEVGHEASTPMNPKDLPDVHDKTYDMTSLITYSVISAAIYMIDIRGACSITLAFVVVLFPHLRCCVVVEVRHT
jgi:hypothetical protein